MGDALFHIAWSAEHDRTAPPARQAGAIQRSPEAEALLDEDEIL